MAKANLTPLSRKVASVTNKEIQTIIEFIKNYPIHITGSMSWNEAQVTAGGVDTFEFACETLESSIVSGLYASGEVLDVYGGCGGYNLQWAWATGFISGTSAAKACDSN